MLRRLLLSFLGFCLIMLQACAEPALSAGHDVDPEQDVIIGSMDAKNELILSLSPGQTDSLTLFLRHYRAIKAQHIDKNRLRVVVREVPQMIFQLEDQDGGLTGYRTAQSYSAMLGLHLRCADHYQGREAYTKTWELAGRSVALALAEYDDVVWPYFDRVAMETVFFNMGKESHITRDQYASCDETRMKRSFAQVFARNTEILTERLNITAPPAAFLNGEPIVMTEANNHNELMLVLKENLDPEYALSRD